MRPAIVARLGLALLACSLLAASTVETQAPARLRIGTFDSRAVALAYYRSPATKERMQALRADLEKAKAANDEKRVKELEAQGPAWQMLMHLQVFSNGSIGNVTAVIADRLPAIAAAAGVSAIVSEFELAYAGTTVERVDVTAQVAALFNPGEAAKKMIESMKGQKPIGFAEALAIKDW
jgi:hypothetical protein